MSQPKKPVFSWALSRTDFAVFRVLLLVAPLVYLVTVLLPKIIDWARGHALVWTALYDAPGPAITGLTGRATVTYADTVQWTVPQASALQWFGAILPTILTAILLIAGCLVVWRLVRLTQSGDPFTPPGVRGVRWLAVLVVAYGGLLPFGRALANALVLFPVQLEPAVYFRIGPGDAAPFVIGILLGLVAECFRLGLRLRDDVEGLV